MEENQVKKFTTLKNKIVLLSAAAAENRDFYISAALDMVDLAIECIIDINRPAAEEYFLKCLKRIDLNIERLKRKEDV